MIKLATLLLDMCTKKIPHSTQSIYSTSDYFPTLLKTVNSPNFSRIIIPTESQLKLFGFEERSQEKLVYIESIGSKFEMLNSLVRPKKFTFIGSDKKSYIMLSKPDDDLRKDARLMEITNLVNVLLNKNYESHRRNLHINTYVFLL